MKKKFFYIISFGICGAILLPILKIIIYTDMGIPCKFNKYTGLYCPGCGTTRAIKSLIKGDFIKALDYNCCTIILGPIIIITCIYDYIKRKKDKNYNFKKKNKIWYVFLAILVIFGIIRNIPYFYILAP